MQADPAMRIGAVVLAAGSGQRLSGGAVAKALTVLADDPRPMVRRVVDTLAQADLDGGTVVVTGHQGDAVAGEVAAVAGVSIVHNPDYAAGMAGSLRLGIGALAQTCDAVLIALADMPFLALETVAALCGALLAHPEADAVVPVHDGQRGNPVLWTRAHFADIMNLKGDRGARGLLDRSDLTIVQVPCGPDVVRDIDTPAQAADVKPEPGERDGTGRRGGI